MSIVENVADCPLFAGLEPEDIKAFQSVFQPKVFHEGENIITEGDKGSSIVILTSGMVSISNGFSHG